MARILVVEDQPGILRFMYLILQQQGHDVTTSMDGDDALRLFDTRWFDLLIVNMFLPSRSGLQVAQSAWQSRADVPVLFISGYGLYDLQTSGVAPQAALPKPFTPQMLTERVNQMLASRAVR